MLILNIKDNGLACDCAVCRVLIMTYRRLNGLYYLVYYIWYIAFMEGYYFQCVNKTIEQIYLSMCLFIRKLFVMAYSSVQNKLFYN